MRVEILQPFTCSRDGGSVDLKAGQEAFITGDNLLRALEDGGYIRILPVVSEKTIAAIDELERGEGVKAGNIDELIQELNEGPENAAPENLTVKHIGRGRFAVHKGNERVSEPMTKEEAEAALDGIV